MSTRVEPVSEAVLVERAVALILSRAGQPRPDHSRPDHSRPDRSHPDDPSPEGRARSGASRSIKQASSDAPVRVLVDGHPSSRPERLADSLVTALEATGHPVVRVRVEDFLRPRSLRLERGHADPESLLDGWIDVGALNREVLHRAVERREYLPSLRDPVTDRATRATYASVAPGAVVLLDGALAIGRGLALDVSIHLALKAATIRRRTPEDQVWSVSAYEQYAQEIARLPDLTALVDHPDRPAIAHG